MASAGFGHENVQHYNAQSADAFRTFTCGHCGVKVAGALLAVAPGPSGAGAAQWVRCSSCAEPSVISVGGDVYPGEAGGVDERPLDPSVSRAAGRLCAAAERVDVVDAHVALIAGDTDIVVTSDAQDLRLLLTAAGSAAAVRIC